MSRRWAVAALPALVFLAGACGGAPHAAPAGAHTSTTDTAKPLALGTTTARPPGAPAAHAAQTAGAHALTAGGGPAPAPASAGASQAAGPAPVAPGVWHYHQSGTSTAGTVTQPVPSEGTLVVDPANSSGVQVSHRYVDPRQPPSDTTTEFRMNAIDITSEVLRSKVGPSTATFTCTFAPPIAAPPWPPAVGATFGGTGNCGSFTATVSGRITGTTTATVGGASVPVFVVATSLVTHGQVAAQFDETDWFDPGTRMSVHIDSSGRGTYGFTSFSSHTVSDLESLRPS